MCKIAVILFLVFYLDKGCVVDIEFDLVDKSQICLITGVYVVLSL